MQLLGLGLRGPGRESAVEALRDQALCGKQHRIPRRAFGAPGALGALCPCLTRDSLGALCAGEAAWSSRSVKRCDRLPAQVGFLERTVDHLGRADAIPREQLLRRRIARTGKRHEERKIGDQISSQMSPDHGTPFPSICNETASRKITRPLMELNTTRVQGHPYSESLSHGPEGCP